MTSTSLKQAKLEIDKSLSLCKFSIARIGLALDEPKSIFAQFLQQLKLLITVLSVFCHVVGDLVYIGVTLSNSPQLDKVVPYFHTFGYGVLSIAKVSVLWYKRDVFRQLIEELAGIWPTSSMDKHATNIKENSMATLKLVNQWYFGINVIGVWFYNLTPIGIYFYQLLLGHENAQVGYVWVTWYPFDKYEPVAHVFVYIFEMYIGVSCVWIMVGTDLLFAAMASHICLLFKLLQQRMESLASTDKPDEEYYRDLIENIKFHQRLIRYCEDLEDAFSVSNFVNIAMSSVNICCVVFVIVLLEPFLVVNSKMFLISALIQTGLLCWYGDDILRVNAGITKATYFSKWYRTSPKCRRTMLFLLIRSQKPTAITAMKFTNISLTTYFSILRSSYSYFALLYTMYKRQ